MTTMGTKATRMVGTIMVSMVGKNIAITIMVHTITVHTITARTITAGTIMATVSSGRT